MKPVGIKPALKGGFGCATMPEPQEYMYSLRCLLQPWSTVTPRLILHKKICAVYIIFQRNLAFCLLAKAVDCLRMTLHLSGEKGLPGDISRDQRVIWKSLEISKFWKRGHKDQKNQKNKIISVAGEEDGHESVWQCVGFFSVC